MNLKIFTIFLLFNVLQVNVSEKDLKEIDLSAMISGWQKPQKNKSILGYPIKMNGKKYKSGVGVHAKSKFMLNLDGLAKNIKAIVGVDDNGKEISSLNFYILGDQKLLWESGVLRKGETKQIDLNIKGAKILALYVSDAKDGQSRDYANFANARFET